MKQKLQNMLCDLQDFKRDRISLQQEYVEERLLRSLAIYERDVDSTYKYLHTKKGISVLKKLNRNNGV